jgi:hypothetical protein
MTAAQPRKGALGCGTSIASSERQRAALDEGDGEGEGSGRGRRLLPREAVAQTPAAKISCRNRTNTNWRSEPNQSSQAVEGSEEPAHDAGLEHTDARLCPSYNARRLCDSLA